MTTEKKASTRCSTQVPKLRRKRGGMALTRNNKDGTWSTKDNLGVRCPCCRCEFETKDYVPFTPQEWDLHNAAPDLLEAAEAALYVVGRGYVGHKKREDAERECLDKLQSAIRKAKR